MFEDQNGANPTYIQTLYAGSWDMRLPSTKDSGVQTFIQSRILGYEASFDQSFLRPKILGVWSFLQPKIWGTKLSSTKDPGIWSFLRPKILGVWSFLRPRILGYEAFFDQRSWAMKLSLTKDPGLWSFLRPRILGVWSSLRPKILGVWSSLWPCFQAFTHVLKGSAQTSSEPCLLGRREAWTFMTLWGWPWARDAHLPAHPASFEQVLFE